MACVMCSNSVSIGIQFTHWPIVGDRGEFVLPDPEFQIIFMKIEMSATNAQELGNSPKGKRLPLLYVLPK